MKGEAYMTLTELGRRLAIKAKPPPPPKPSPRPEPFSERVVNGSIKRRPIDRTAAIVTAPANWIHQPDAFQHRKKKEPSKMQKNLVSEIAQAPRVVKESRPLSETELTDRISQETIKRKDRLSDQSIDMAIRVLEAREALDWATNNMKASWFEWMETANKRLEELRQLRYALDAEAKHIISYAGDVRKFFLEDSHVEEMARLKEFVGVCERLEALKKRGTLDAIADTILKLAV